jgi:hypothetical protein
MDRSRPSRMVARQTRLSKGGKVYNALSTLPTRPGPQALQLQKRLGLSSAKGAAIRYAARQQFKRHSRQANINLPLEAVGAMTYSETILASRS